MTSSFAGLGNGIWAGEPGPHEELGAYLHGAVRGLGPAGLQEVGGFEVMNCQVPVPVQPWGAGLTLGPDSRGPTVAHITQGLQEAGGAEHGRLRGGGGTSPPLHSELVGGRAKKAVWAEVWGSCEELARGPPRWCRAGGRLPRQGCIGGPGWRRAEVEGGGGGWRFWAPSSRGWKDSGRVGTIPWTR